MFALKKLSEDSELPFQISKITLENLYERWTPITTTSVQIQKLIQAEADLIINHYDNICVEIELNHWVHIERGQRVQILSNCQSQDFWPFKYLKTSSINLFFLFDTVVLVNLVLHEVVASPLVNWKHWQKHLVFEQPMIE